MNFESRIKELETEIDNILTMTVTQRLACHLQRVSGCADTFSLPITKTVLALRVGIEKETLSRCLPKLGEIGVQVSGKIVSFTDKKKTAHAVCRHCIGRDSCEAYRGLHGITAARPQRLSAPPVEARLPCGS